MVSLRALRLTIKAVGFLGLLREASRRILGLSYSIDGVPVVNSGIFRGIRAVKLRGYKIYSKDGYIYVETPYAKLRVRLGDFIAIDSLLHAVGEGIEELYSDLPVQDRIVLDIGALAGETSLYFVWRGAFHVYAYEPNPRFYSILIDNIKLNDAESKITPVKEGLWFRRKSIRVRNNGIATGLKIFRNNSYTKHETDYIILELNKFRNLMEPALTRAKLNGINIVAKIDCEGCEYTLMLNDCNTLRAVSHYLVEIHGAELPLVDFMEDCGFKARKIKTLYEGPVDVTLWLFSR